MTKSKIIRSPPKILCTLRYKKENSKEKIPMKIVNEGKQLAIRLPSKVVEALDIRPSKDIFLFEFDKDKLHLTGELQDQEQLKRGRRDGKKG